MALLRVLCWALIFILIMIIVMKTLLNFLRIYTIVNLTTDLGNLQLAT